MVGVSNQIKKRNNTKVETSEAVSTTPKDVQIQNDDSGIITLTAATANIHGSLNYIAEQNKIGRWSNESDWINWDFELRQPGKFDIELSCGQTEDGSVYQISVGDQKIKGTVVASGDFKKPKIQKVGTITLSKQGTYVLSLKPVSKQGTVFMTFWQVNLIPVLK